MVVFMPFMQLPGLKPGTLTALVSASTWIVRCFDCIYTEAAFLRALELSPFDEGALFNLAMLYGNNGFEEDMRSTLQQLLQVRVLTAVIHALPLTSPSHYAVESQPPWRPCDGFSPKSLTARYTQDTLAGQTQPI
jgi:hypothetical protein